MRSEKILSYSLPKDTVAVCLMLYDTEDGLWSLQLHGFSTFDKNVAFYEWRDNFNSEHNTYKWDRNLSESDAVHIVVEAIEEYIKTGEYKDKLSTNKAVAVVCRFHIEFPYEKKISNLC